ncbi:MAG: two component, sigma54 specific, transcriptional regulator, Fis family [Myxococcaceae bacterium]|nr:two component, sigma54 specific, transcriptional regulator, Fis family [Myxococcaceae bacterium]
MNDQRDNRTTVERDAIRFPELRPNREPRAAVVVYAHDDTRLVELRESDSILVGRAPPADLVVEDMTISRQHARFTYRDGHVLVEDLGSRNGTLVRGVRVTHAQLRSGDDVRLGGVAISIHLRGGAEPPLGISSYDQLLGRLEDELVRARTFGHQFSVVAVFARSQAEASAASPDPGRVVDDRHVSRWAPRVRDELRPVDAIAVHGPYSVLVLMPEANAQAAERVSRRLARLSDGIMLQCGIATYPETAKSAGALVSEAHTAARSASSQRPIQHGRNVPFEEQPEPVVQALAMQRLYALADRIANNNVPVLIVGETGTGKEVIARHVHRASHRGDKRMVVINCAALPPNLIESALFGHEKGSFTGADAQKKGVFEEGDHSTVFLDEVGELSPAAQAALLRVLETKRFSRVGSAREIEVDARIVAATHRDLEAMVEAHTFRADLYYRLNTMTLKVPALRDRREEIGPLARAFLAQTVERWNTSARDFAPATLELLCAYRWPGNVRELRNVIERAAVICTTSNLEPEDLPERVRSPEGPPLLAPVGLAPLEERSATLRTLEELGSVPFRDRIRDYEVKLITDALDAAAGNQSRAAEILRMPLRTLVHKIRTYGLKKTYKREDE